MARARTSARSRVRRRAAREDGLTLIELLVVITIAAALAALALSAFGSQKNKATDAQAKANLDSARKAMENYFVENGTYVGANTSPPPDPNSLLTLEPTLSDPPVPTIIRRGSRSYRVQAISLSQLPVTFQLRKRSNGTVVRTCSPSATGGCSSSGTW